MNINTARIEKMRASLEQAFSPIDLVIQDESHLHAGHAGAKTGKGHFFVLIVSDCFKGKSRVEQHQMVYKALAEMMEQDIHALRLETKIS